MRVETEQTLLVSICIPTFNRSDLLRLNLENLTSLSAFDDEVELIISDNNSTDDTGKVVDEYIRSFPSKRIVYHRNDTNIRDKNFLKALSLGNGRYLKLYNDYTRITNEDLNVIKGYVKKSIDSQSQLFFYNELRKKGIKEHEQIVLYDTDSFLKLVNNKTTWISNFGCWREQLDELYQFESKSTTQLLQVYWTFHLVSQSHIIYIVNMKYDNFKTHDQNRTSYNFFQVHVANYYKVLNYFKELGYVKRSTIKYDKKRVLGDFIGWSIINYIILHRDPNFKQRNSNQIIIKHFWNIPFFYVFPLYLLYKKMSSWFYK